MLHKTNGSQLSWKDKLSKNWPHKMRVNLSGNSKKRAPSVFGFFSLIWLSNLVQKSKNFGEQLTNATSSFASDIVKSAVAEIKTTYQELEKGIVEKTQSVADFVLPYVYLFSYETAYFRYPL